MIDYSDAYFNKLIAHSVGNKSHDGGIVISEELVFPDESLRNILMEFFLSPFKKSTETYQFQNEGFNVDTAEETLFGMTKRVFSDQNEFKRSSQDIVKHLYQQSNHPHIKSGDVFIVLLGDVLFEGELVDALGIFKVEDKVPYLNVVTQENDQNEIISELGISIKKLDKGCLIFNTDLKTGAKVLTVDSNCYDTDYWLHLFLDVDYIKDGSFETRNYVEMVRAFSEEDIKERESKKEQIDFLNQSIAYFDENDLLIQDDFEHSVFEDEDIKVRFSEFKTEYENDHGLLFSNSFDISPVVLKNQKRAIKNFIKLDTNIKIQLDFRNPDSSKQFIEKGFDEDKEMYFYKVFFNEEVD